MKWNEMVDCETDIKMVDCETDKWDEMVDWEMVDCETDMINLPSHFCDSFHEDRFILFS